MAKDEYDAAVAEGEPVFRAAFLGVTYHAG